MKRGKEFEPKRTRGALRGAVVDPAILSLRGHSGKKVAVQVDLDTLARKRARRMDLLSGKPKPLGEIADSLRLGDRVSFIETHVDDNNSRAHVRARLQEVQPGFYAVTPFGFLEVSNAKASNRFPLEEMPISSLRPVTTLDEAQAVLDRWALDLLNGLTVIQMRGGGPLLRLRSTSTDRRQVAKDYYPGSISAPSPPEQIDDASDASGSAVGHVQHARSRDEILIEQCLEAEGIEAGSRARILARWRKAREQQTSQTPPTDKQPGPTANEIVAKNLTLMSVKERREFLKARFAKHVKWKTFVKKELGGRKPTPTDFIKWADKEFPHRVELGLFLSDLTHIDRDAYSSVVSWTRGESKFSPADFGFPSKVKHYDPKRLVKEAPSAEEVYAAERRGDPNARQLRQLYAAARHYRQG